MTRHLANGRSVVERIGSSFGVAFRNIITDLTDDLKLHPETGMLNDTYESGRGALNVLDISPLALALPEANRPSPIHARNRVRGVIHTRAGESPPDPKR